MLKSKCSFIRVNPDTKSKKQAMVETQVAGQMNEQGNTGRGTNIW